MLGFFIEMFGLCSENVRFCAENVGYFAGRVPEWFEYHGALAQTHEGSVPPFGAIS